jgi:hypothetical protein
MFGCIRIFAETWQVNFFWNGDFKKLFFSQGWNIRASFAKLTQGIKSRKMQKCKKCKFFIIQMCLADTGDHFSN